MVHSSPEFIASRNGTGPGAINKLLYYFDAIRCNFYARENEIDKNLIGFVFATKNLRQLNGVCPDCVEDILELVDDGDEGLHEDGDLEEVFLSVK